MIQFQNSLRLSVPSMYPYVDILTRLFEDHSALAQKIHAINSKIADNSDVQLLGDSFGFGINLAMDEAIKNAIQHGNGGQPEKSIEITHTLTNDKLTITVQDQGQGFAPPAHEEIEVSPESESGRGLLLIYNFMDEVYFNEAGNSITMIKYISGGGAKEIP